VTNETPSATKDSSKDVAEHKVPGTPTAPPAVTNENPPEAKDLHSYIWGAVLAVMIVSLFAFSIWKILIKRGWGKGMS
jgi:hypothetical protein